MVNSHDLKITLTIDGFPPPATTEQEPAPKTPVRRPSPNERRIPLQVAEVPFTPEIPPNDTMPPTPACLPISPTMSILRPSASLRRLFPKVTEDDDLQAVITHELPACDLYKLDIDNFTVTCRSGSASKRYLPMRYPTPNSVYIPLCTYFDILSMHIKESHQHQVDPSVFFAYITSSMTMAEECKWESVLEYHLAFFDGRREDMVLDDYTRWGVEDAQLMANLVTRPRFASSSGSLFQPTTNYAKQGWLRIHKSIPGSAMISSGHKSNKKLKEGKHTSTVRPSYQRLRHAYPSSPF